MRNEERMIMVFLFVIGMILLFWYIKYVDYYPYFHVYDVSPQMMGEKVTICGSVNAVRWRNNILFFRLEEGESHIDVVSFSNSYKDSSLEVGDVVCVKGEIKLYKSKLEVISHEISHENTL